MRAVKNYSYEDLGNLNLKKWCLIKSKGSIIIYSYEYLGILNQKSGASFKHNVHMIYETLYI